MTLSVQVLWPGSQHTGHKSTLYIGWQGVTEHLHKLYLRIMLPQCLPHACKLGRHMVPQFGLIKELLHPTVLSGAECFYKEPCWYVTEGKYGMVRGLSIQACTSIFGVICQYVVDAELDLCLVEPAIGILDVEGGQFAWNHLYEV